MIKKLNFIISILFTFCLSLQNFFPVHRTITIQTIKENWCYGNSRDICLYDQVMTLLHNKMVVLKLQNT